VGISIIFPVIVLVLGDRFVWSQFFKPNVKIMMKAGLIVINKNRRRYVHSADENEPLFDSALPEASFHLPGNVDISPPCSRVEPKLFPEALHLLSSFRFR